MGRREQRAAKAEAAGAAAAAAAAPPSGATAGGGSATATGLQGDADVDRLSLQFAASVAIPDSDDEADAIGEEEEEEEPIAGGCRCGACRFEVPESAVLSRRRSAEADLELEMINCHCGRCRSAHAAAFATFVEVRTADVRVLEGRDVVSVRADACDFLGNEVLRVHCSSCFSALATFARHGDSVLLTAGCLDVDSLPEVSGFVPRCKESAPAYLGYVPKKASKKQREANAAAKVGRATGGCSCGGCRYELKHFPEEFQHCYCEACRRLSGAAWQTWMPTEDGDVVWTKRDSLKLVRTTKHGRRHVCTACGVFLTIVYDEDGAIWPLAGTIDDKCFSAEHLQARVTDVSHICVKWKQPWWTLPSDGLKRVKGAS
eukprot:TRINITY_DN19506_c0_g1_i1.p1 TRINITY_DN19506_c0_g1~~TRINITY_DN19506_c0_g1_i1.p1  ORF type:complete len:374 (-),score=85.16 TRINITY_DN19506_c0_g1_i1:263-1384(-)